jgi:teichuronic acid biosynthesis glycosyltransferase TuaC
MVRVLQVIPGTADGPGYIFAKRQVNALEKAGVITGRFFLQSRTNPLTLLQDARQFRRSVREFNPDIVHAHYGTMTSFFCAASCARPLVITFRGADITNDQDVGRLQVWAGHALSYLSALRASGIICVAAELREGIRFASLRRRAEVITGAVDLELFKPMPRDEARGRLGWDLNEKVALFNIGNAPRRKRLDLAQGAVDVARARFGNLRLATMAGEVAAGQVPLMMNAADCLLMTSDAEGSPNVVREAMACNLPVVSVEVGDVVTRLRDVQPSRIVGRTAEAVGRAVIEILEMSRRSNGREIAMRELSEPVMVERVMALYARVLAEVQGGRTP